jgi:hypothetical protein
MLAGRCRMGEEAMHKRTWLGLVFCCVLSCSLWGCGGGSAANDSVAAPVQPNNGSVPASEAMQPGMVQSAPQQSYNSGPPNSAPSPIVQEEAKQKDEDSERPGLATKFGEDLKSDVRQTSFYRESAGTPFATTTVWYNDAQGAAAVTRKAQQRSGNRAEVELFGGGLVVRIGDGRGNVLPGFIADGKPYAIGSEGQRYAIQVENRTDYSFEILASVDGLGVVNGRPASFNDRGYILRPHQDLWIDGFRTSDDKVAAFRFGKVDQSYSVEMGHGDANVGVVGVAFFEERGTRPLYTPQELRRREDANPFPGQYAPRPLER